MPLYLPRGGDYERALEYMTAARGIEGAMAGASQGLGLVMNMQKIADNALSYEIKEEEYAESRAKSAAGLYAELDQLRGDLRDVIGGEDAVYTGKRGKRAKGGARAAAAGAGGLYEDEAADLAEALHTAAEYEALQEKFESFPEPPRGKEKHGPLDAELVLPDEKVAYYPETTQEYLWGTPPEDAYLKKEEDEFTIGETYLSPGYVRPDYQPGQRVPWTEEGIARQLTEEQQREPGYDTAKKYDPKTGGAIPGITARGADIPRPYEVDPRTRGAGGVISEGLINPAVSMGFSSKTVVDPVSQMYLAVMHERGSGVPTSIANMLGVDRDKLFAPGAVGKIAAYQGELAGALRQFVGDEEEEDVAAMTRVITARLESAGLDEKVWTPEKIDALARDLAPLDAKFVENALDDIMSLPAWDRERKLAKIRRVRISYTTRDGDELKAIAILEKTAGASRRDITTATSNIDRLEQKYRDIHLDAIPAEDRKTISEARKRIAGLQQELAENKRQRDILWRRKYPMLGPLAEAPEIKDDPDPEVFGLTLDNVKSEVATWKTDLGITTREEAQTQLDLMRGENMNISDEVYALVLAEYPSVVEPEITPDEAISIEKRRIRHAPGSTASARKTRKSAKENIEALERNKAERADASKAFDSFTDAVDSAERVKRLRDVGAASQKEAGEAIKKIDLALKALGGEEGLYEAIHGRDRLDDLRSLIPLRDELVAIYGMTGKGAYPAKRPTMVAPRSGSRPGRYE